MSIAVLVAAALALGVVTLPSHEEPALPALNLDLSQTTVSGVSSGAYMAVQFGVAHSASVRGVAATAGGPYFCAGTDYRTGGGIGQVISRCMQGDSNSITDRDLEAMSEAARAWAGRGMVDDVESLAKQSVWLFHGNNDGIVAKQVSDALYRWYSSFVPPSRIVYKNDLNAGHGQISAACGGAAGSCQPCAVTGGDFINACPEREGSTALYDAAGSALQLFYGPLIRTDTVALKGKVLPFDQRPYVRKADAEVTPKKIAMADSGYVYVPPDCAAGRLCRLHVAFHGCRQQADSIGTAFVAKAGFNEWADANRIVVLYPQTTATYGLPGTPLNPHGCWDWWGYNDAASDLPGRYATKEGLQVAAVWRMVQQLASGKKE